MNVCVLNDSFSFFFSSQPVLMNAVTTRKMSAVRLDIVVWSRFGVEKLYFIEIQYHNVLFKAWRM